MILSENDPHYNKVFSDNAFISNEIIDKWGARFHFISNFSSFQPRAPAAHNEHDRDSNQSFTLSNADSGRGSNEEYEPSEGINGNTCRGKETRLSSHPLI